MTKKTIPGPPDRFHLKCSRGNYSQGHKQAGTDWVIETLEELPSRFSGLAPSTCNIAHMVSEPHARRIVASWNALAGAELEDLERDGVLADPRVATLVEAAKEMLRQAVEGEYNYDAQGNEWPEIMVLRDALRALEGEDE